MDPIRVTLVDDHTLLRAGIRSLLQGMAGIQVVAEAGNGQEALALVRQHPPHVVCTDIRMPVMGGLEMTEQIARDFPAVHVLILSMHDSEEYVCQALRVGASGYLLKDSDPGELEFAIRAVARGESYLTPLVSRHVITDYVRRLGDEASPLELLTPRQREILPYVVGGWNNKEIAKDLNISVKTVETHRQQMMDRLDIHDLATLILFALRAGIVPRDRDRPPGTPKG